MMQLPQFWRDDANVMAVMDAIGGQLAEFAAAKDSLMDASCVSTATGWALEAWETALGLVPAADAGIEDRRSAVMARLRAPGICTAEKLKRAVGAFHGGEVEILEDVANGVVTIRFVGQIGTPRSIADVTAAVEMILPAHLLFRYEYKYLTLEEVAAMDLQAVAALTLDRFAGGA